MKKPLAMRAHRPLWLALGFALAAHVIVLTHVQLPSLRTEHHAHELPVTVSIKPSKAHYPTLKHLAPAKPASKTQPPARPSHNRQSRTNPSRHQPKQPSQSKEANPSIKRPASPIETQQPTKHIDADAWARQAAREAAKGKRNTFEKSPSSSSAPHRYNSLPALRSQKPHNSSPPPRIIGGDDRISKIGDQCYATHVPMSKGASFPGGLPPRDLIFSTKAIRCPNAPARESFTEGLSRRLKALDRRRGKH